ncbi:retrovirus-related Pol polyprotein from transposon 412 [Trichonephila clavipes]|nr:retrovirus-related Pol polyprotein from transposon 412 [Trichonephila clavipes]
MKTRYDTKATGHQFKEGDKVWFYNPTRRKGLSPKLQSHWDGPYTILKIINDVVIRIRSKPLPLKKFNLHQILYYSWKSTQTIFPYLHVNLLDFGKRRMEQPHANKRLSIKQEPSENSVQQTVSKKHCFVGA